MRGGGIAAAEGVIRQHGLAARQRIVDRDARPLRRDLDAGKPRGPAGGVAIARDDREQGLAVEGDVALDEHRIVAEGGRDVVLAGNVRRGQHRDDAGRGADRGQVEQEQAAAGLRRAADGDVQRAFGLADVVDVLRRALHVLDRGIVRQRLPDMAQDGAVLLGGDACALHGLVHGATPPPQASGDGRRCAYAGCRRRRSRSRP